MQKDTSSIFIVLPINTRDQFHNILEYISIIIKNWSNRKSSEFVPK